MGDREGEESYGFAPRGQQARRDAAKTSRLMPNRQRSVPNPARMAMPPPYSQERTETPVWLWLGIGILLGIGATLLTSSLWLPSSGEVDLVDLEANERIPMTSGVASANEATLSTATAVTPSAAEEPAAEPSAAGAASINGATSTLRSDAEAEPLAVPESVEARDLATSVAALEADIDAALSSINRAGESDAPGQDSSPTIEVNLDQIDGPGAEALPEQATIERLLPADDTPAKQDTEAAAGDIGHDTSDVETTLAVQVTDRDAQAAEELKEELKEEPNPDEADVNESVRQDLADLIPAPQEIESRPSPPAADVAKKDVSDGTDIAVLTPAISSSPPPSRTSGAAAQGSGRLYRVQLAAVANEAAAQVYWREVNERLPGVFSDVEPVFNERVVDQRLYLRIWVGSFGRRSEADTYCGWLKDQGQDCFVTRVDNL